MKSFFFGLFRNYGKSFYVRQIIKKSIIVFLFNFEVYFPADYNMLIRLAYAFLGLLCNLMTDGAAGLVPETEREC